jgi:hypothetical protein
LREYKALPHAAFQFNIGGEVRRDGLARRTELTAEFQVVGGEKDFGNI